MAHLTETPERRPSLEIWCTIRRVNREASDACPVEIIKFGLDTEGAGVVEVEATAEVAAEIAVAPVAEAVAVAGAASEESWH